MGGEEGEEFKWDSPVPCLGVCAELAQAFDELLLTARLREPVTLTSCYDKDLQTDFYLFYSVY